MTAWERADRMDVREFVEWLRETPNQQRLVRRPDAPAPGSVNPITGKAVLPMKYASRTINHQLSVLFGFYEFACVVDLGPMVNPVPAQRAAQGGRLYAHHNPMEDFVIHRRATRAVLQRVNAALGANWTLHDFRHTAAARLLADPAFTLFDVQTILRHASVSTTQIYAQPRLEELVGKVLEHYARPRVTGPTIEPSYDSVEVLELLGIGS
jgi:hypothetical protein